MDIRLTLAAAGAAVLTGVGATTAWMIATPEGAAGSPPAVRTVVVPAPATPGLAPAGSPDGFSVQSATVWPEAATPVGYDEYEEDDHDEYEERDHDEYQEDDHDEGHDDD